jgi:aerobic carbon-monoxide dehydrogenase small subunit
MTNKTKPIAVSFRVNGLDRHVSVDPRYLLADVLRDELLLTGLHLGCEQGVCGACMVFIDGEPAVSCLTLAMEAEGSDIRTVEDLSVHGSELGVLEKEFLKHGAFQCGFCTPGFLIMGHHILNNGLGRDREAIQKCLSGNVCRCTGYEPIIDAIVAAGAKENRT